MAYELSIRTNGKAEMAFVGGETPWHGLGQAVTKGASIGVWAKEAGMDWEAKEAQVLFRQQPVIDSRSAGIVGVESHKVIYRGDTGAPLGVVGAAYNPVQPREVLEFFRDEVESGGWYIHTAGVLRGGRKLWAMATNGESDLIGAGKSDRVLRQVLLATSLDGTMKTVVKPCATVVVCANTLNLALQEAGKVVTISHRSVFDAQAVKRALGMSSGAFDAFLRQARELADTPIGLEQAHEVLGRVFGVRAPVAPAAKLDLSWMGDLKALSEGPAIEDDEPDERMARSVGRVLELFDGAAIGGSLKGRKGTRWGLLNAVTEFADHEMGRSPDTRIDGAWFGRGDQVKQAAFQALTAAEA